MTTRRVDKLKNEIVERYKLLRAVRICYYTLLQEDVGNFSHEFFFVVGDILEGKPLEYDKLKFLKEDRVVQCLKEDR